jgi:hypothetical protein
MTFPAFLRALFLVGLNFGEDVHVNHMFEQRAIARLAAFPCSTLFVFFLSFACDEHDHSLSVINPQTHCAFHKFLLCLVTAVQTETPQV